MPNTVIKVENISKQYRLGQVGTGTISHDLNRWWAKLRGKEDPFLKIGTINDRTADGTNDYVWALKDINFEVKKGEILGIIGRNGAGKSTLLKILSRTTTPTIGNIKIKGRVASLLEVGTGFSPELTGRENIYLNGTILGMSKAEVKKKFDEIVDFSGVQKYVDTPVKRYSSGMYVRLAFAVAAHLEPDILIVDEVLAVGDAEFQKKCLGKMQDVSTNEGRTVLFVSHNMGTILQLCQDCILLNQGQIEEYGNTASVVERYYNQSKNQLVSKVKSHADIYVKEIFSCNATGEPQTSFSHDTAIHIRVRIGVNKFDPIQNIGFVLLTSDKRRVFTINKFLKEFYNPATNEMLLDYEIEANTIAPNDYSFLVALHGHKGLVIYDWVEDVCEIKIYDGGSDLAFAEGSNYGYIIAKDSWKAVATNTIVSQ